MAGTLLTTTVVTIVPAAYAGGDNDDGNQQKAEDDSSAGTADCDRNDVEEARLLCIAIAANNIEIEEPEEPEESATLSVCKEVRFADFSPDQFDFTVTGNNPDPVEFEGDNSDGCVDVTIGPGEYTVTEAPSELATDIEGDCVQDPNIGTIATGEIQAGETQECRFINFGPL
jgi:hypothetical protein